MSSENSLTPISAYGPHLTPTDTDALLMALQQRQLIGAGPISKRVERMMSTIFDVRHVLLTASGTAALEMAMLALDIGPGDEVIMPSFTFVSTANCVVLRGAKPIFAEIKADTLNLDSADVARRITPRTRAILPVHYAGVACDMDALKALAAAHHIPIVEDAAQGIDACYRGQYLGTIGTMGCFSFHATKNIVCGEGGAFLTNDTTLAHKAEIIREKGTNRSAFFRGDVDKYTWVNAGSSYILSDLLAALVESQLAQRAAIKARRQAVWQIYQSRLSGLAQTEQLILPTVPDDCDVNYHIYFVRTQTHALQDGLIHHLRAAGVPASFHFVPLHTSPYGKTVVEPVELPVTDHCAGTLVRLPIGTHLSDAQVHYVCDHVISFFQ